MRKHTLPILAAMLLTVAHGCGYEPERVAVTGQVKHRDRNLPGGAIVLSPDLTRGTVDELAYGEIKPDGTYQLLSEHGESVAVGWYRVTVAAGEPYNRQLPAKYTDPRQSGLECYVRPGGDNTIDFNLQ